MYTLNRCCLEIGSSLPTEALQALWRSGTLASGAQAPPSRVLAAGRTPAAAGSMEGGGC